MDSWGFTGGPELEQVVALPQVHLRQDPAVMPVGQKVLGCQGRFLPYPVESLLRHRHRPFVNVLKPGIVHQPGRLESQGRG